MSDGFYNVLVLLGRFPMWVSSRPVVLHRDRIPRSGAFILASNHTSAYDIPVLMRHTPRKLDFVSVAEFFARPFAGWSFRNMNAFPLERSRSDPKTVRAIVDHLAEGRVVAMFPEGGFRRGSDSVVHGGSFQAGVAGIARLARVPIIPVVVWGSNLYGRFINYLPLKHVRYGIAFGEPIVVENEDEAEARLAAAYRELFVELSAQLSPKLTQAIDKSRSA